MDPVGSDPFKVQDFSETFETLDRNPGVLTIPNQSSRPTGWNADQHGRRVWQADQNIEWVWNQPSSSQGGEWQRTYARGLIGSARSSHIISTTSWQHFHAPLICSVNTLLPGGRPITMSISCDWVSSTGFDHYCYANIIFNGDLITRQMWRGYHFTWWHDRSISDHYYALTQDLAPRTQKEGLFELRLSAPLGGGLVRMAYGRMEIFEA
jgi:hypothetical protein